MNHESSELTPARCAVLELACRVGVTLPICEQVGAVLFSDRHPKDAAETLMERDPIEELHDLTG